MEEVVSDTNPRDSDRRVWQHATLQHAERRLGHNTTPGGQAVALSLSRCNCHQFPVLIHTYIRTHIPTHIYTNIYTHMHTYTLTDTYAYIHTYRHTSKHTTNGSLITIIIIDIYIHKCVHTHTHSCTHTCVHIYIHTCTHMYCNGGCLFVLPLEVLLASVRSPCPLFS